MPQTPIGLRLDDDLLRRVDGARGDVPRARWIAAALERALSSGERGTGDSPRFAQPPSVAAPTRTPTKHNHDMARQAKLNEAKYGKGRPWG